MDGDERMIHAGSERQVARREPMAGVEQNVARFEVEPLQADVAALC
jgi:hypothetical protein